MSKRYEIRDSHHPRERGQRFTSEDRARRELAHAVGSPDRFELIDRETGAVLDRAPRKGTR